MKGAIFASLGAASIGIIVGLTAVAQLSDLKNEIASTRREIAASRDRAAQLEKRVGDLLSARHQVQTRPDRENDQSILGGGGDLPLDLSRDEVQLVRDYIKVPPAPPGAMPRLSVGDKLSDATLLPLPPQIGDKFPRLRGARFTTDPNGGVIIVRRGSGRVDAVISPY